ncbi:MAG: transposase [Chloroflexales bacterium]|nr:transposase [Chloroflexales bacterium]
MLRHTHDVLAQLAPDWRSAWPLTAWVERSGTHFADFRVAGCTVDWEAEPVTGPQGQASTIGQATKNAHDRDVIPVAFHQQAGAVCPVRDTCPRSQTTGCELTLRPPAQQEVGTSARERQKTEALRCSFQPPREEIVELDGDRLIAVVLEGDGVAAPVRLLCDSIGLDPDPQMANIRVHPVSATGLRVVAISGKRGVRSVAALLHTMIPYWLATVAPNEVNAASRPKLIRYQREVANILAQLFYGSSAVPELSADDPAIAALQQRMRDASREVRIARDALLFAQQQYTTQLGDRQRQITAMSAHDDDSATESA